MRVASDEPPRQEFILDSITDFSGWIKSSRRFRFNIARVAAFGYHRAGIFEALWE
jgi:hypothetical protein